MAEPTDDEFADLDVEGDEELPKQPVYHSGKKRPKLKKPLIGLLIIIVIAGLVWAGIKLAGKSQPASQTKAPAASSSEPAAVTDTATATSTKTYNSETMALQFDYPSNWTLTTEPDNSVRVTSPNFTYKTVAGSSINGYFRLYIRQTARPEDSKYIARGIAVAPSVPLTYAKPTSTQRKTTYLTNFGLDSPDNFNYFFIAGNFNLNKGDSLGPTYGQETGTDIIAGGYSDSSLKDDLAMNSVPLSYYANTNAYKQAVDIVKSLQLQ